MYEAINNYVIAKQSKEEDKTDSGIILNKGETVYTVVATTEETKDLQDRQITFSSDGYTTLKGGYLSVDVDKIVAVHVV